jgi:hypothetical protein
MSAVSVSRFARVACACLALGLPFAFVATTASGFVEPLSRATVDALLLLSAPLAPAAPAELPLEPELTEVVLGDVFSAAPGAPGATQPAKGQAARSARPQPPGALFVSAAKVLELSQAAVRPAGAFVPATAQHPAGLRLSGVASLGIGVQDGDILIEALGVPPRSPGQIIGAIIEARAKQARYLGGTLWRRGQTFRITVEQPYLPAPPAASGRRGESS